jgi:Matrixin
MMNRRQILVLALLAALTVSTAFAYTLLVPRRTWDSPPSFTVDNRGHSSITDGDRGATRTVQAILTWNTAGTGTRLSAVRGSMLAWAMGDGRPTINFSDPLGACTGSCLAATVIGYSQRPGGTYRITDADIVTNPNAAFTSAGEPDGCSNEYYIESVMVREVGKVLGLGNSSVTGATMNPSTISPCSNAAATLEADDIAAINDLY